MFGLTILQLILILIITEIIALDSGGPQTQLISKPVVAGTLIGAILGDMTHVHRCHAAADVDGRRRLRRSECSKLSDHNDHYNDRGNPVRPRL